MVYTQLSPSTPEIAWRSERCDATDNDNVFARLPKNQYLNDLIKAWAQEAQLSKHATNREVSSAISPQKASTNGSAVSVSQWTRKSKVRHKPILSKQYLTITKIINNL